MSLSPQESEVIRALIEEGVMRSADNLGKLSRTEWGIMSSSTKEMPAVRMLSWFDRVKEPHVGATFRSQGGIPLEVHILFSERGAKSVTEAVTRRYSDRLRRMPDLVPLTIGEIGNIVAQSVIGALADKFGLTLILTVPRVKTGPKAEVMGSFLENYDGREDVLLLSHVEMYSENLAAECSMVMSAGVEGLRSLFRSDPVA